MGHLFFQQNGWRAIKPIRHCYSPAVKEHFWWKTFFHNLIFLYISYGNNTSQKVPASSGLYFVSPGALTWEVFKPNHQWISPTCIGTSVKQWFFGRIYKYTDLFETLKLVLNNILIPLLDCQLMCPSLYVWVLGWMNVLKRLLSGIIAVSLSATPSTNDSEVVSFDTRKKNDQHKQSENKEKEHKWSLDTKESLSWTTCSKYERGRG